MMMMTFICNIDASLVSFVNHQYIYIDIIHKHAHASSFVS